MRGWKKKLAILLFTGAAAVFCAASVRLFVMKRALHNEEEALFTLAGQVGEERKRQGGSGEVFEAGGRKINLAYREAYLENSDLVGWLMVEGTRMDYPVMLTPQEPEFYIHRDFQKEYAYCGLPFLHPSSSFGDGGLILVYGHHMRNGSMFADLMKYKDGEFWQAHPAVLFDDLEVMREYRIFSAFYTAGTVPEGKFDYQRLPVGKEERKAYVEDLKAASLYDTGLLPEEGDRILLLSTCSYHTGDGRFVAAAFCKEEDVGRADIEEKE